jgi:hypothetical protein
MSPPALAGDERRGGHEGLHVALKEEDAACDAGCARQPFRGLEKLVVDREAIALQARGELVDRTELEQG